MFTPMKDNTMNTQYIKTDLGYVTCARFEGLDGPCDRVGHKGFEKFGPAKLTKSDAAKVMEFCVKLGLRPRRVTILGEGKFC